MASAPLPEINITDLVVALQKVVAEAPAWLAGSDFIVKVFAFCFLIEMAYILVQGLFHTDLASLAGELVLHCFTGAIIASFIMTTPNLWVSLVGPAVTTGPDEVAVALSGPVQASTGTDLGKPSSYGDIVIGLTNKLRSGALFERDIWTRPGEPAPPSVPLNPP